MNFFIFSSADLPPHFLLVSGLDYKNFSLASSGSLPFASPLLINRPHVLIIEVWALII